MNGVRMSFEVSGPGLDLLCQAVVVGTILLTGTIGTKSIVAGRLTVEIDFPSDAERQRFIQVMRRTMMDSPLEVEGGVRPFQAEVL